MFRTYKIVSMCQNMLDSENFEALPILNDMLLEENYTDEKVLAAMLTPDLQPMDAKYLVWLIYSEETEAAVKILMNIAQQCEVSFAELMEGFSDYVSYAGWGRQDDDLAEKSREANWSAAWNAYKLLTGEEFDNWYGNIYECPC